MRGTSVEQILERMSGVRRTGKGWQARCPAHEDRHASLSVSVGDDGKVLLHCHAGCSVETVLAEIGLTLKDLSPQKPREGSIPQGTPATLQPLPGCTLSQYAEAKRLPLEFLQGLGLTDAKYAGAQAVRIPYLDPSGAEAAVRFRTALAGADRFRWKKGAKPCLYGLWRLHEDRKAGRVVLVEGESDCHTLWHHGIPALGLPGASTWREEWAEFLDGIPTVYVVLEPDKGGETVRAWLATSRLRERVHLLSLRDHKDPSALYLANPEGFRAAWEAILSSTVPWQEKAAAEAEARSAAAWAKCQVLAQEPRILDKVAEVLVRRGVVGEARAAKLIYLAVTSRLLDRPVSVAVKGPSSGGKSFLAQSVLDLCPAAAYYALSAMSERALAYSEEPLSHRVLVIYEAAGMSGEFASYLMRSLLSEGQVRYETVEKTKQGLRPRLIVREGPTGLLVTTTKVSLHPENETRLLSLPVTDTAIQTKAVLKALACGVAETVDLEPWRALQEWLELGESRVVIPYAEALAEAVPPVAVRLRRDFSAVLNLIRAHAILHRATRDRDADGRIVATLDDYAVVRALVADLVADGVDATVPATVRETVQAVRDLQKPGDDTGGITVAQVARSLKLDKSAAWRRAKVALEKGYLKNLEDRKGRTARLVAGEPLPEEVQVLPTVEALARCVVAMETGDTPSPPESTAEGCTVAGESEGISTPPTQPAELMPATVEGRPPRRGVRGR